MASTISRFALTTGLNTRAKGAVIKPSKGACRVLRQVHAGRHKDGVAEERVEAVGERMGHPTEKPYRQAIVASARRDGARIPGYTGQNATKPINKYTRGTTIQGDTLRSAERRVGY